AGGRAVGRLRPLRVGGRRRSVAGPRGHRSAADRAGRGRVTQAPIHYDRGEHDAEAMVGIVAEARASVVRATAASLDALADDVLDGASRSQNRPVMAPPWSRSQLSRRSRWSA